MVTMNARLLRDAGINCTKLLLCSQDTRYILKFVKACININVLALKH